MFSKDNKTHLNPVCVVAATDSEDKRTLGRFVIDSPDKLHQCEESDTIADNIIAMAQSLAATKSPGETVSVALLSDHPEVYYQQILLSLAMKTNGKTGLTLGLALNNRFEFTKL